MVKDFAIYLNPNDKDSIITKNLCEVIKTAFPTDLLELFTKTSWIGNDSIHYENKHDEFNTKDFKSLIKICISDIEKEIRKKQYLERIQKK